MGALLGLLINTPAVGKPPHIQTHCECDCSDTSSSSDDSKNSLKAKEGETCKKK
jgi:hypothetical protein